MNQPAKQVHCRLRHRLRHTEHNHIILRLPKTVVYHFLLNLFLRIRIKHFKHTRMHHRQYPAHAVDISLLPDIDGHMAPALIILAHHMPLDIGIIVDVMDKLVAL